MERLSPTNTVTFHTRIARALVWFVSIPCLVLTVLSVYFFQHGTHMWFERRFRQAMNKADKLVVFYFKDQENINHEMAKTGQATIQRILNATPALESSLMQASPAPDITTPLGFSLFLGAERFQNLTQAMSVISRAQNATYWIIHRPFNRSATLPGTSLQTPVPPLFQCGAQSSGMLEAEDVNIELLQQQGWPVKLTRNFRHVMKVSPLRGLADTYMVMMRPISHKLLSYSSDIHRIAEEYNKVAVSNHQVVYSGIVFFIGLSLLCMAIAVGWGLIFSRQSIRPITALMEASLQLRQGVHTLIDVSAHRKSPKELQHLLMSFNQLSQEVEDKTRMLRHANDALKTRNHFIEGVLESLSSGIIVLHGKEQVLFYNLPAQRLFPEVALEEQPMVEVLLPDLSPVLAGLTDQSCAKELSVTMTRGHQTKTFQVHVQWMPEINHTLISIDDISDVIAAQKKSAWSDVACRIAHEIKNPLTPIALSAERLKRRLSSLDDKDRDIVQDCIDTIIRQTHHIGTLISEFSQFARLPAPHKRCVDVGALVNQIITWHQQAYPAIHFSCATMSIMVWCDPDQIEQVMTNVIKNALEAIEEQPKPYQGAIHLELEPQASSVILTLTDNGVGLPEDKALTLCEPYLTTKSKGMGLGLAIVQKIIADHEGFFTIQSRTDQPGTCVTITLPLTLPGTSDKAAMGDIPSYP